MIFFLVVFIALTLFYIFFLLTIWRGLLSIKKISVQRFESDDKIYSVSLIIAFRDEEKNISRIAKLVQELDYPENKLEIIFVDDFSSDSSISILKKSIYRKNIKVISKENRKIKKNGKKLAILEGISISSNDIIVTTDADCFFENGWLKTLIRQFDNHTAIISGPVEFVSDGKFFNELLKLEFSSLVLSGAGLIGANFPIICNGANLAYRKKAFYEVNGFEDNLHLSSGDDDILLQKLSRMKKYKATFCYDKKALVKTFPPSSFKEFINQRRRWASKGLNYSFWSIKIVLILIFLFYLQIFIFPLLWLAFGKEFLYFFLISLAVKIIFEIMILKTGEDLFNKKINIFYFIFAEIIHIPYIIISSILGAIGNFNWKNRKLKR